MASDPTMATDPAERLRLVSQMERLREMIDEGEVDVREGDRQYGQMARRLIGDVEYMRAQQRSLARRSHRS